MGSEWHAVKVVGNGIQTLAHRTSGPSDHAWLLSRQNVALSKDNYIALGCPLSLSLSLCIALRWRSAQLPYQAAILYVKSVALCLSERGWADSTLSIQLASVGNTLMLLFIHPSTLSSPRPCCSPMPSDTNIFFFRWCQQRDILCLKCYFKTRPLWRRPSLTQHN